MPAGGTAGYPSHNRRIHAICTPMAANYHRRPRRTGSGRGPDVGFTRGRQRPAGAAKPEWLSLNGLWQYSETDGFSPPPVGRDLPGQILVPYPTESALSGVQKHSDYMFYRRTVDVPSQYLQGGKHLRLNFGAVNYDSTVLVNGSRWPGTPAAATRSASISPVRYVSRAVRKSSSQCTHRWTANRSPVRGRSR